MSWWVKSSGASGNVHRDDRDCSPADQRAPHTNDANPRRVFPERARLPSTLSVAAAPVRVIVKNVPRGLGASAFDKLAPLVEGGNQSPHKSTIFARFAALVFWTACFWGVVGAVLEGLSRLQ